MMIVLVWLQVSEEPPQPDVPPLRSFIKRVGHRQCDAGWGVGMLDPEDDACLLILDDPSDPSHELPLVRQHQPAVAPDSWNKPHPLQPLL